MTRGIQRQQPHGLHAPQQVGQCNDFPPDALCGKHRQVIRLDKEIDQFTAANLQAVLRELVYSHELPRGQQPLSFLFLFSIQTDTSCYIMLISGDAGVSNSV